METALKLLMRDGAAQVAFHPRLSLIEYADLLERVARATTKDELRQEMQRAADQWGKRMVFDTEIE
jgi:hypothetical protein